MPKDQVLAAAIDLGSTSFSLLVGLKTEQGLVCLLKKRASVRLARGLTENGSFTSEAIRQALEVLDAFRADIDRLNVTVMRCCGTEAFHKSAHPEGITVPAAKNHRRAD